MNWYPWRNYWGNFVRKHVWPGQTPCNCTRKHSTARKLRARARHAT